MKIKTLTVQGFRGFNNRQSIDFNDRITLIYAPNSYGKTSISESFEWLIYGATSKVEKALTKTEFKGSYRNLHFPKDDTPSVQVNFSDKDRDIIFIGELDSSGEIQKFIVEGKERTEVDDWPLDFDLSDVPKPFIMQHALQYLLMTKPDERFQGFARLLGFEELDKFQKDIISLCTKPKLPDQVGNLIDRISVLSADIADQTELTNISIEFRKKRISLPDLYDAILSECKNLVPPDTKEESMLPQLLNVREEEVAKIFKGSIVTLDFAENKKINNELDQEYFFTFLTKEFIEEYISLIALATLQEIIQRENFLNLGFQILKEKPDLCPFCGREIENQITEHIKDEHQELKEQKESFDVFNQKRTEILANLETFENRLDGYHLRYLSKVDSFLEVRTSLESLTKILMPKYKPHLQAINKAVNDLQDNQKAISAKYEDVKKQLKMVIESINVSKEDTDLAKSFGRFLTDYLSSIHTLDETLATYSKGIAEADQVLQHELDLRAGTEVVSVLINALEMWSEIEKWVQIELVVRELSVLRESINEFVANKILEAIAEDLTGEVMHWYDKIKTAGDPDVHFEGFDLERTTTGKVKSRRVQIRAKSYGEELVSAVSSLSESKLNALGLCMSLATNLKGDSPFDFILIDDPIQSLDSAHEVRFIQVIRELSEIDGVQLIILSHNKAWLDQVCAGCRSLNGWYYEITGYTKKGPHIIPISWVKWSERLKHVNAIANDPSASSVKLQQAEEEIRIVVSELTSELYKKRKGVESSPHKLNSTKVHKILTECRVDDNLVDRIGQTFCTTDDSHHAPTEYVPDRERIKQYHSWAHELSKLI